jgi:hypothetical protein
VGVQNRMELLNDGETRICYACDSSSRSNLSRDFHPQLDKLAPAESGFGGIKGVSYPDLVLFNIASLSSFVQEVNALALITKIGQKQFMPQARSLVIPNPDIVPPL